MRDYLFLLKPQGQTRYETGDILGAFRCEAPRIIPVLNRYIEKNKDYWKPPTDERKQYVNSDEFCLEDLRYDSDISKALDNVIISLQKEVKRIGAYRVDQISVLEIPDREWLGHKCFFRAHCSV